MTKESIYIRKELNSHRIGLVQQHGRRFIVLKHKYGFCDVMWKHSHCMRSEAHHWEPATTPYSCHGVFTDRSVFSLNFSRIHIRTGASVTICNHKHRLMSTWCRHVHVRPHCFIFTEACSCRLELAYLAEKYRKIDWSVKMPLHRLIMGVAGS